MRRFLRSEMPVGRASNPTAQGLGTWGNCIYGPEKGPLVSFEWENPLCGMGPGQKWWGEVVGCQLG